MSKISIKRIINNEKQTLLEAIDLIGGILKFVSPSDRVMLKPNINGAAIDCTNINLVEALIQILFENNVKNVFIGESSFGNKFITEKFFNETGYRQLAEKYGIDIVNFNAAETVDVDVKNPQIIDKIKFAKDVFEADKIINIPVMKVHYATGVTLGMKNLKGLLASNEKRRFHEIGLDKAIVDLNNSVDIHLNIIDCITCMEKMGPRGGDTVSLNTIIVGENIAHTDYVGAQVMGYTLDEVKHLKYYVEMNKINLDEIELVGDDINKVKYPFKKVDLKAVIPDNVTINDTDACSSCMNALILSLGIAKDNIKEKINFYLGSQEKLKSLPEGFNVAFGVCNKNKLGFDAKINGCPPYPFALNEILVKRNEKLPD